MLACSAVFAKDDQRRGNATLNTTQMNATLSKHTHQQQQGKETKKEQQRVLPLEKTIILYHLSIYLSLYSIETSNPTLYKGKSKHHTSCPQQHRR